MLLPSAIIFINDVNDEITSILSSQLYISEIITGEEFDLRIANDPNYPSIVHNADLRILVKREDYKTNGEYADVIGYVKNGLFCVMVNNVGPMGLSLQIDRLNIYQLLVYNEKI